VNTALIRSGPRRGSHGRRAIPEVERERHARLDIEQAAERHRAWLASRPACGVPDLVHLQAIAEAEAAQASEARLLAELRAELQAEREQEGAPVRPEERELESEAEPRPAVYVPARVVARRRSPDKLLQ
jgi:hypothetical protein